jgi:nucleotide-binding universal stress UspA family protein
MKILLAFDGSEPSLTAASVVSALTLPVDSTVELLTVIADDTWAYGPWPIAAKAFAPADFDRAVAEVRARLDGVAEGLAADRRTIRTMVRHGRPATEIVLEAERFGADLTVVGALGHGAVERLVIGSVSSEVVDQAHGPVLVVRAPGIARVLVATDGSADGNLAAQFVRASGIFGDPVLKVLSVVDPGMPWWAGVSPVDGMVAADIYVGVVEAAERQAEEVARSTAQRLGTEHVAAAASPRGAEVGSTIVAEATAWQADVVTLGTRGHGLLHRALVGSTSRHVLHHAPMSVLIVRPARVAAISARTDAA